GARPVAARGGVAVGAVLPGGLFLPADQDVGVGREGRDLVGARPPHAVGGKLADELVHLASVQARPPVIDGDLLAVQGGADGLPRRRGRTRPRGGRGRGRLGGDGTRREHRV